MSRTWVGDLVRVLVLASLVGSAFAGAAQLAGNSSGSDPAALADSVRELRQQVQELQAAVAEIRAESQKYRAETLELRHTLEAVRATDVSPATAAAERALEPAAAVSPGAPPVSSQLDQKKAEHNASLEEQYQLLSGKIDDQYQTKVESASKYRVRLSGIVLLNLFSNRGTVENIDFPSLAYPKPAGSSGGSVGATLRQSQIGFELFGPRLAGARTKADLQLDLAGGFAQTLNGVNSGLMRLRTGTLRMDWTNTSIVAGQDSLFFSPNSPTSFASLAVPALSYAGNLWSWVAQVRVEHHITLGEDSNLLLQAGVLDPLSGEPPPDPYYRQPQAGEQSRQPAYATRLAWTHNVFGQTLRLGAAGYYSRQNYSFDRNVDAWAGMADLDLPLTHRLSLSGKLYRGRGLGGLGGGIGRSALFSDDPSMSTSSLRALNSIGGWAQLQYRATNTLEFNGAFGQDNPYAADVRAFPYAKSYADHSLVRNQGSFVNAIYRPRSDLLFSAEYRFLRTFNIDDSAASASHISLTMGVLF